MKPKYNKVPINKFIGLYKEPKDISNGFSHYAIISEDFHNIETYISFLENQLQSLKYDYNNKIESIENNYSKELDDIKSHYLKSIDNLEISKLDLNLEINRLEKLNGNLLRICKERANQQRGLFPKKSHNGFLIISRQSMPYKFYFNNSSKSKKSNYIEFECFKTKIQTPFSSSINLDLIKTELITSFKKIMSDFNIDEWYNYYYLVDCSSSELTKIFFDNHFNFIFKHSFISNFKSNLWDLEIYTKKDIVN